MRVTPDFSTFQKLTAQGNVIPLSTELTADFETPVSAYAKLRKAGPAFLLESVEGGENLYRYSFFGCRPRKTLAAYPDRVVWKTGEKEEVLPPSKDPLGLLQEEMKQYQAVKLPGMPRFAGGAVGFLAYDIISSIEPTVPPIGGKPKPDSPLLHFSFVDSVVILDRVRQTLRICVNAHLRDTDPEEAYRKAVREIEEIRDLFSQPHALPPEPLAEPGEITVPPGNFSKETFERTVEEAKEYIRAGDIIQVVLSQKFTKPFDRSPLQLYRSLRTVNPSPYMFLYENDDFASIGASPEVHVRLTDGLVEIRPIAGTRPRGATAAEDRDLEKDLLADAKERAEHLMLVDLARNDIGRVCQYGSVHVPEYMIVERYSHVMHIVSQVEGQLAKDRNAFDLMKATFPAGTVSGAPKVRAMQIIAEKEPEARGLYAGALGYFSYDGNLDSCIAIRTAWLEKGELSIQSGAGIVADSNPASEYQETVNKAKGMLKAVQIAETMGA
ncbi:MAG: anthranilate synthase component I [Opitutales bacterium]|nr:anthranilate synthase component I [Opitutales bacterium]